MSETLEEPTEPAEQLTALERRIEFSRNNARTISRANTVEISDQGLRPKSWPAHPRT